VISFLFPSDLPGRLAFGGQFLLAFLFSQALGPVVPAHSRQGAYRYDQTDNQEQTDSVGDKHLHLEHARREPEHHYQHADQKYVY
jgi:hypothetical protein